MNPLETFKDIFGMTAAEPAKPKVDPAIAFSVWIERQPLHRKLQAAQGSTINIYSADVTRILQAAFLAGFHRAQQP